MIIDWLEYDEKEHVLAWFLLEAMSKAGIDQFGEFDSSKLDVELKVNGVEVPITAPMEFLQKQLSDIRDEGRKLGYEQARQDLQEKIEELLSVEL